MCNSLVAVDQVEEEPLAIGAGSKYYQNLVSLSGVIKQSLIKLQQVAYCLPNTSNSLGTPVTF